jgi:putative peptidoglycan binding protein
MVPRSDPHRDPTTIRRGETMKRYNVSTRVLGAVAALTLAPVAFAQTAQDPTPNDLANDPNNTSETARVPSGDSYGQQPANRARVPEMSDTHGTQPGATQAQQPTAQASPAASSQQRAIDPREVQQVFGQQASLIDIKSLNTDEAKNLQQRLKDLGYYKGEIDGVAGPQTKSALSSLVRSQFALTQRLVEQGQMPTQLANTLGLRTDIVPTSGRMDQDIDSQPRTMPEAAPRTNQSPAPPPASSYDTPPMNYDDSPRSPSGNAPMQQRSAPAPQRSAPKR